MRGTRDHPVHDADRRAARVRGGRRPGRGGRGGRGREGGPAGLGGHDRGRARAGPARRRGAARRAARPARRRPRRRRRDRGGCGCGAGRRRGRPLGLVRGLDRQDRRGAGGRAPGDRAVRRLVRAPTGRGGRGRVPAVAARPGRGAGTGAGRGRHRRRAWSRTSARSARPRSPRCSRPRSCLRAQPTCSPGRSANWRPGSRGSTASTSPARPTTLAPDVVTAAAERGARVLAPPVIDDPPLARLRAWSEVTTVWHPVGR